MNKQLKGAVCACTCVVTQLMTPDSRVNKVMRKVNQEKMRGLLQGRTGVFWEGILYDQYVKHVLNMIRK